MIEWKFTIDLDPKSKATSCRTYSHNRMYLRIHRLFYLNLLHKNTPVCDFEIPLKGFRSLSVVNLYVATCFQQCLIIDLVLVDACRVKRLQKPHKFHRSNSQDFQEHLKHIQGFPFCLPSDVLTTLAFFHSIILFQFF